MRRRIVTTLFVIAVIAGSSAAGLLVGGKISKPGERVISITARQYAYDPSVIRVSRGDKITLKMKTQDIPHGFYLEGYYIDAVMRPQGVLYQKIRWEDEGGEQEEFVRVDEVSFTADRVGKFRYRCSQPCGPMHPFMLGELIVGKNFLYTGAAGLAIGVALATLIEIWRREHG